MKVIFATQEVTPKAAGEIYQLSNKYCYIAIKAERFTDEELKAIEDADIGFKAKGKSQSQQIRAVLYLLWQQDNKGYDTFDRYYKFRTDEDLRRYQNEID